VRRALGLLCALALLVAPGTALAQQSGAQPPAAGPQMPMPGMMGGQAGGTMQGGMMGGMGMCGAMCPMMSGMMGGGMGMTGGQADAKTQGRMLQMRGEMMKAMGDVLIKHGKALETGK
jgi:hypothetical protein